MKVLMFFHGGSQNRGCEAIVRSSTKLIKENIKDSKVYLVSGKPETDEIISELDGIYDGSDCSINKFSYDWLLSSVKVKFFNDESFALGKIHQNIIKHINQADVCLSIGGDNYCYGEQPGWYEIDKRVKAQGKKLVLWGCSIGEEDLSERKLEDLKMFDLILARETLTLNVLRSKGLSNVELCADSAFTLEKEELPLPEGWQEGNTIGINFSPLVWRRNQESKTAVKNLINHILETTDMTIALTPHVIDDGNNDYEILKPFYEEYKQTGRVLLLPDHLNATQYKGYIARMRFFIGARTHATIAAYSSLVPTMVLGYSVKSKGIAKDIFGEEKLVLGIDEISNSRKLKDKFNELMVEEAEIRHNLEQSIPDIKQKSHKAVSYLNNLFALV
ncbi:polysaccharide pyruvyl transferase family protein [Rossellomorea arthrocnemi]